MKYPFFLFFHTFPIFITYKIRKSAHINPVWGPDSANCGLGIVQFLELVENDDHVKNHVDQIPFDIISKWTN